MLQITAHPWETFRARTPTGNELRQKPRRNAASWFSPRISFSHLSYKVHARMPGVGATHWSLLYQLPPVNQENAHSHTHRPIWSRQLPQLRLTQITLGCKELRVEANIREGCAVLEKKICLWVIVRYWRHRGKVEFNATIVPLHNGPKILEKLDGHSSIWGMGRD